MKHIHLLTTALRLWLIITTLLFAALFASGETPSNREIITVGLDQEFVISVFSPAPRKYPNDWYSVGNPSINPPLVEFTSSENVESEKVMYRFRAIKRGETNINIYKIKGGKNSVNGLAQSTLVKIE